MSLEKIKGVVWLLNLDVLLSFSTCLNADDSHQTDHMSHKQVPGKLLIYSYTVNKQVSDFPPLGDFSISNQFQQHLAHDIVYTGRVRRFMANDRLFYPLQQSDRKALTVKSSIILSLNWKVAGKQVEFYGRPCQ